MIHESVGMDDAPIFRQPPFLTRFLGAIVAAIIFVCGSAVVFSVVGPSSWNSMWLMGAHGLIALALLILVVASARSASGVRKLMGQNVIKNLRIFVPLVILAYAVCVGLEVSLGFPREEFMVTLFAGLSTSEKILCVLMIVSLPPISEELFFRHFLMGLFPLKNQIWRWVAIIATAAAFTLVHTQYSNWPTLLLMTVLGVLLAVARVRSNGLVVPILLHSSAGVCGLSLNWLVGQFH